METHQKGALSVKRLAVPLPSILIVAEFTNSGISLSYYKEDLHNDKKVTLSLRRSRYLRIVDKYVALFLPRSSFVEAKAMSLYSTLLSVIMRAAMD